MKFEWLCLFLGPFSEIFCKSGSELTKIPLSRTPVDNERLGCQVQIMMTWEVRFRDLLAQ